IARGIVSEADYEVMEHYTRTLFEAGTKIAAEKGLILVDTKYEFGKRDGKVILIDEIHTPDSSRYFYADTYQKLFDEGQPQRQLSKEFVRQWLIDHGFMGKAGQTVPEMSPEFIESVSERYIELYEHITGEKFVKAPEDNIADRIATNVLDCLNSLEA
ncbi:MAG: phosphoribosylaminoimidazolesuccinocarboxamide synthase, partial [Muribaculaceae bacterium]|nr:phosphoribosylaminoimidazolesuccinocarboxamide synthase [Muribaculaceae bacterium]